MYSSSDSKKSNSIDHAAKGGAVNSKQESTSESNCIHTKHG